jgi:phosphoglycerate kinase
MARFLTLDDLQPADRRMLVRVDLNVPLEDGRVADAQRIERIVPTIETLLETGARVVLLSHLGRPKGERREEFSLKPLVPALEAALGGRKVAFAEDCIGSVAAFVVNGLTPGSLALLENLRFHPGEEANDPDFARQLAELGDLYVNDAFSVSHRAHASVEALAHLMPAAR